MRHSQYCFLLFIALAIAGCMGNGSHPSRENGGSGRVSQPSDTLYTEEKAMDAFVKEEQSL